MSEEKPTLVLVRHVREIHLVEAGPHKGSALCRAIFFSPGREADAALFIRAQHMDELVEAARACQPYLPEASDQTSPRGRLSHVVAATRLDAILAKIDQHKE